MKFATDSSRPFLGKKRCELQMDGHALDGNAAEDHLAELLGFDCKVLKPSDVHGRAVELLERINTIRNVACCRRMIFC